MISEDKLAKLRYEKALMLSDMARPGFQLIMTKLQQAADKMLLEYDDCDFAKDDPKALRIKYFREVVNVHIPGILERTMNVDGPERAWKYNNWLKSVRECISDKICDHWLGSLKSYFANRNK